MTKSENSTPRSHNEMHSLIKKKMFRFLITLTNRFITSIVTVREFLFKDIPRAFKNFEKHDGELSTCAMAFYLLISFIPLSLVIISALSFFYDSGDLAANIYMIQLKKQLPSINIDKIITNIDRIVYQKRYLAFIWIPFLFWWGSLIFDIFERALEKAFMIEKSRKYWKAKIRHFVIIIGISVSVIVLTMITNVFVIIKNSSVAGYIERFMDIYLTDLDIFKIALTKLIEIPLILSSTVTLSINTLLIFILYRFVPPKKIDNKSMFKGALFASLSYEIIKFLFSYYITEINDYTSIFGSLSTIVILIIWIWYSCFLFVIGAEIAWVFYERKRDIIKPE